MLKAAVDRTTATVIFTRGDSVPDQLWNQLGRNISPTSAESRHEEVRVPLSDFLASRNWLASTLTRFNCGIEISPTLESLLDRDSNQRAEVLNLISLPFRENENGPITIGGRFTQTPSHSLKPFQLRDLRHILSLSNAANFSVPGAGKTAVAYACYEAERQRGRVQRLLVVAPLSAFESWSDEAERWFEPRPIVAWFERGIPRNCEILIVNYHRLVNSFDEIAEWVRERPCHVILDEAHRMKAGQAKEWGRHCLDLSHLAERRDILTGTPAPQHPKDLIAQMEFLWPRQSARILPQNTIAANPTTATMNKLSSRLRPFFSRTTKNELGLRKPRLRGEFVTMKPIQRDLYDIVRGHLHELSRQDRRAFADLAEVRMYMLEAATNPSLLATALGGVRSTIEWPPRPLPQDASCIEKVLSYLSLEVPSKFEKLASMIAANVRLGRKTLVWSNFVGNLEELSRTLLSPYQPALIYGQIPSSKIERDTPTRESELRRFRYDDDCWVLLANPQAMSEGVSLHLECHDAIYLDRTFNAGQYLQSLDRIHRLGLSPRTETRITFLISRGTIDEIVDLRVRTKAERLGQMLDDRHLVTMALPDDEDYGEEVDVEDVEAIMRHLAGPQ